LGAFDVKSSSGKGRVSKDKNSARAVRSASVSDYSVDTVAKLVSVYFTKQLTYAIIGNYASRLRADQRFSPLFDELVDLREVELVDLSARDLMNLAERVDPFSLHSKRAFVVESQAQIHAAQLHRILRKESKTIRVFLSMDEARQWIEGKLESPEHEI
jgi:hypothetical protein